MHFPMTLSLSSSAVVIYKILQRKLILLIERDNGLKIYQELLTGLNSANNSTTETGYLPTYKMIELFMMCIVSFISCTVVTVTIFSCVATSIDILVHMFVCSISVQLDS